MTDPRSLRNGFRGILLSDAWSGHPENAAEQSKAQSLDAKRKMRGMMTFPILAMIVLHYYAHAPCCE